MNEETFNLGVRKFLKRFGVTAQREMERVVAEGIRSGRLTGTETLKAHATLAIDGLPLRMAIEEDIPLEER
ncbi:MAG TPA: DUF6494 family protein [Ramlibacter sp.]|nr:DUF6494 family protein [Ramlibacter sp.]